jgi:hypothetical protein
MSPEPSVTDRPSRIETSATLEHFLRLARAGKHKGCSSGEQRARNIAHALLNGVPGLDDSALTGITEFIGLIERAPMTARDLIK